MPFNIYHPLSRMFRMSATSQTLQSQDSQPWLVLPPCRNHWHVLPWLWLWPWGDLRPLKFFTEATKQESSRGQAEIMVAYS